MYDDVTYVCMMMCAARGVGHPIYIAQRMYARVAHSPKSYTINVCMMM